MTIPVYRPILLTRNGELQAVSDLAESVSASFAPVFAVHPPRGRSLAGHFDSVARKVALRAPGPTVAVDTSFVDEHHDVVAHPLLSVSEKVEATLGPALVPVVTRDAGSPQTSAAAEVQRRHGAGVCVRLPLHDATALMAAAERLDRVVDALGVAPRAVDLVLDAADADDIDSDTAHELLTAAMQPEPDGTRWRSVTLCASSFPHGVAAFPQHEVSRVRRRDWLLWVEVAERMRAAGSDLPDYGDYGIADPALPDDVAPQYVSISTHLRYSVDDEWLIAKGEVFNGEGGGRSEVVRVARMIAEHPEFKGANFSAGDRWIADVAAGRSSETSDATRWRRVGTNHHITLVTRALANRYGP